MMLVGIHLHLYPATSHKVPKGDSVCRIIVKSRAIMYAYIIQCQVYGTECQEFNLEICLSVTVLCGCFEVFSNNT